MQKKTGNKLGMGNWEWGMGNGIAPKIKFLCTTIMRDWGIGNWEFTSDFTDTIPERDSIRLDNKAKRIILHKTFLGNYILHSLEKGENEIRGYGLLSFAFLLTPSHIRLKNQSVKSFNALYFQYRKQ
jgi:hypothetical protein